MEKIEFLPLGSIVKIPDAKKRLLIIARALNVQVEDKTCFFDYGACPYPEGLQGNQVVYFQHADIEKVLHIGFADSDEIEMVGLMNKAMEQLNVVHTNVKDLRPKESK